MFTGTSFYLIAMLTQLITGLVIAGALVSIAVTLRNNMKEK